MNILFIGDTHGNFENLLTAKNYYNPEIIISCGDFGYWPNFKNHLKIKLLFSVNNNIPIYFCAGNHENWDYLDFAENKNDLELFHNVFYQPTGTILEIPEINKNILFFGGAYSINKNELIIGQDWFPQETMNIKQAYEVFDKIEKYNRKIDIVVSHTTPKEFKDKLTLDFDIKDPTEDYLSHILKDINPEYWFFGHFHKALQFKYNNTFVSALNMEGCPGFCINMNF